MRRSASALWVGVASRPLEMSVLIFGMGGWLGGLVALEVEARGLAPVAALARGDDYAAVVAEVRRVRPALVFSALGRTHGRDGGARYDTIDYLELPGRLPENLRDNLVAPLVLAAACARAGVPFACLGTGCIFGEGVHDEEARPSFAGSSYSAVKGAADELLRALFADSALWFRIRMPITHAPHPRSFLSKILRYERICSARNSMSVLDGPAGLLGLFVDMALAGYTGCYNGCNPGALSHDEVLEMYRSAVDPSFAWRNFTAEEQARVLLAPRSNTELCSLKLRAAAAELGRPLPCLRSALASVLASHAALRGAASSAS